MASRPEGRFACASKCPQSAPQSDSLVAERRSSVKNLEARILALGIFFDPTIFTCMQGSRSERVVVGDDDLVNLGSAKTLRDIEVGRLMRGSFVSQIRTAGITCFFPFYPFLQRVEFIEQPAANLRARRAFLFFAPALQLPLAVAQHCSNATLTDKSPLTDNDLVASSGRRLSIGSR